jgi:pimeloyl-ACP methyl ester carboxylesterase
MSIQGDVSGHGRHSVGENTPRRLLAGLPVRERQLHLGGIVTVVLEGGDGPPLVLLHGPGGNAAHWIRVIPELVTTHRVIAPDLPGQGESVVAEGLLSGERGAPPIPPADLAHIVVPTRLIWGRYDLATRLAVAESTSARYRWPLHVIEDCGDDPPLEQPDAFLRALHVALVES